MMAVAGILLRANIVRPPVHIAKCEHGTLVSTVNSGWPFQQNASFIVNAKTNKDGSSVYLITDALCKNLNICDFGANGLPPLQNFADEKMIPAFTKADVSLNIAIGVSILFCTAILVEYLIRRREARKT